MLPVRKKNNTFKSGGVFSVGLVVLPICNQGIWVFLFIWEKNSMYGKMVDFEKHNWMQIWK